MADAKELEQKFWKALNSDRTVMLGTAEVAPRPMTGIAEDDRSPLWFFTSNRTDLAIALEGGKSQIASGTLTAKNHEVFAAFSGTVVIDYDRDVIERLWNPFVAAWFEGKDDPKLRLLRMDLGSAHVWLNENTMVAGVKLLLGIDPKESYRAKAGDVDLS